MASGYLSELKNVFIKEKKYTLDKDTINKLIVANDFDDNEYTNTSKGTKIIFPVNKDGIVYGFMMYGYTGYAVKPYDIVSSAIASIARYVMDTIHEYGGDKYDFKKDEALMMFVVSDLKQGKGNELSKVLLKSMVSNILYIQDEYKDFIKVYIKWD
jgi:uncharacterized protein YsxB (DUF464 family)